MSHATNPVNQHTIRSHSSVSSIKSLERSFSFEYLHSFWENKLRPNTSEFNKLPKCSEFNKTCPSFEECTSNLSELVAKSRVELMREVQRERQNNDSLLEENQTPAPPIPQTASCTQTDLTFLDNPISSLPPPQPHMSQRESRPAATTPIATSNILSNPPVIESPLFDQVREQIYSEVASLVSENESRPYYLIELLRAAQLLNTDYLRQTGLNSLKRVINSNLNPDQIDPQAFSSFPTPPRPPLPGTILPDTQLVQEEDVQHYLNTDLSGSSENVNDRCVSHVCQLSEDVQQLCTQTDIHGGFGGSVETIDESDISDSDLSGCKIETTELWARTRRLVKYISSYLIQLQYESCEPKLLAVIHRKIMSLFSEQFPENEAQNVFGSLDKNLGEILSSYSKKKLENYILDDILNDVDKVFMNELLLKGNNTVLYKSEIAVSEESGSQPSGEWCSLINISQLYNRRNK